MGMTRRDFRNMAAIYAHSFQQTREYREVAILWDHLYRFCGIAKSSNVNFDREKFMGSIADTLRERYAGHGLADFNRQAFQRYGRTF